MKKTAGIFPAIFMVCISVFSLCSCGSDSKSIVGTWSKQVEYATVYFIFADDNTGKTTTSYNGREYSDEDFSWEIYSKYTYMDADGEKTTYKPTDRYDGVLVITDVNGNVEGIAYYRSDKEKLYLLDICSNKEIEMVYNHR